jgi:hypothetical protein
LEGRLTKTTGRKRALKRTHARTKIVPDDELQRFADAFKDEAQLRSDLVKLLRLMGSEGVRNTHGTGERGKDIVFYGPSGMGELGLYAAVVKKDRIVGDVTRLAAVALFRRDVPSWIRLPT